MSGHGAKASGILVVDDDHSLRAMMAEHLRDLGFTVLEAADPVAALSIVVPSYRLDEAKAKNIGEELVRVADNILTEPSGDHELPQESMEEK